MHQIQNELLKLSKTVDLDSLSLREIGKLVGEGHPQKIKHHLLQLKKNVPEFVSIGKDVGSDSLKANDVADDLLFDIRILGYAKCGLPTMNAEETQLGELTVSQSVVRKKNSLFALIANGDSMNKANIGGQGIDSGDYVIVDSEKIAPKNGDYIVSVIGGNANIKKLFIDKQNERILLLSESTQNYPPIVIHQDDFSNYLVNGTVVKVVKGIR